MIKFKPFKGIRPAKQKAATVATKNIEYYDKKEIDEILNNNPQSYLQVLKPVFEEDDLNNDEQYKKIRDNFNEFLEDQTLLKDNKSFYIYEQEDKDEVKTLGILGIISVDDYLENKIKKHEDIIKKREERFYKYLNSSHIQADPILLTFPENQSVELIISMTTRHTPTLEFFGPDNKTHRLWQVKDRLVMKQLKSAIEKLPSLYIADGHHRMGSAAKYTAKSRKEEPDYFGGESFNYAMAMLIPGNHLNIFDYNRVVKDLGGLSKEDFLKKLETVFTIVEKGDEPYFPSHKHHISLYLDNEFYALYVNQEYRGEPKGLGELDTYLWEKHIMKDILNIDDVSHSDSVKYVKGTGDMDGILRLKKLVDSGEYKAGFGFYPISVQDLMMVSDEGLIMPPKSTYIEPKFLSALTIFDLAD